jgi:hypothetical protein
MSAFPPQNHIALTDEKGAELERGIEAIGEPAARPLAQLCPCPHRLQSAQV